MNKQEFLAQLRDGLSALPASEVEERLIFYGDMIDDRVEDGIPEEEAVGEIGSIDELVSQIIADVPLAKLIKGKVVSKEKIKASVNEKIAGKKKIKASVNEKIVRKKKIKAWEIVLLVFGAPLWLPLLLAFGAILLSLYLVLWSLVISLWAVFAAVAASGAAGICFGIFFALLPVAGIPMVGAGLFFCGIAIFLFFGCIAAAKGIIMLTRKIVRNIKERMS